VGKVVGEGERVGVGGRGVALGADVGRVVAVGGGTVGATTTRVAVGASVDVVDGVGAPVTVGVHVGGSIGNTASTVAVGKGGLKGLNATRGLMKMIA